MLSISTSSRIRLAMVLFFGLTPIAPGVTIHISPRGSNGNPGTAEKPIQSLGKLRDRLKELPLVSEVVFAAGTYRAGLSVGGLPGGDLARHPLLIRAADGAEVIIDGSAPLEGAVPVQGHPGVYMIEYRYHGGEPPRLWNSSTRVRFSLVADVDAVRKFAGSYTFREGKLYFSTSDGKPPAGQAISRSSADYGMFISRPHVTVRGISFRNYRARSKWSTAIDLRVNHITVQDCRASNCSLGFIVTGDSNTVLNCHAEDVGGGVYVGGENTRVEGCRVFKTRDDFMVPMYAQDDAGIQVYHPGRTAIIRNNLCVGFGEGIFIKAQGDRYTVEHNTVVGDRLGLGRTNWGENTRYRHNIVVGFRELVSGGANVGAATVDYNCFWTLERSGAPELTLKGKFPGKHSIIADPLFMDSAARDYRLAEGSPCVMMTDDGRPCGAFPAVTGTPKASLPAELPLWAIDAEPGTGGVAAPAQTTRVAQRREPRTWHISPTGSDKSDGSATRPHRTLQHVFNRVIPGDTILLGPGIYEEPAELTHGGTREAPIVIRGTGKWGAILDSNRKASSLLNLKQASHVEVRDLELRWYGSSAIDISDSTNVTVSGCKIWNDHWLGTWPTGYGMHVTRSPGFIAEGNLLFRQEHGIWLYDSPGARITHNTCARNLYSAATFLYSIKGSVCVNNDFAFQGNDVLLIYNHKGWRDHLSEFECDYNNLGTKLRPQPEGSEYDSVDPRESALAGGSKAIVNYTESKKMMRFTSLRKWREFSGKSIHSIFADPLHVSVRQHRFELDPESPNIGAGKDGATIGAF